MARRITADRIETLEKAKDWSDLLSPALLQKFEASLHQTKAVPHTIFDGEPLEGMSLVVAGKKMGLPYVSIAPAAKGEKRGLQHYAIDSATGVFHAAARGVNNDGEDYACLVMAARLVSPNGKKSTWVMAAATWDPSEENKRGLGPFSAPLAIEWWSAATPSRQAIRLLLPLRDLQPVQDFLAALEEETALRKPARAVPGLRRQRALTR